MNKALNLSLLLLKIINLTFKIDLFVNKTFGFSDGVIKIYRFCDDSDHICSCTLFFDIWQRLVWAFWTKCKIWLHGELFLSFRGSCNSESLKLWIFSWTKASLFRAHHLFTGVRYISMCKVSSVLSLDFYVRRFLGNWQ